MQNRPIETIDHYNEVIILATYITLIDYAENLQISIDRAREQAIKNNLYKKIAGKELVREDVPPQSKEDGNAADNPSIENQEIEELRAEIARLKAVIDDKDRQITDFTKKYTALAERALLLTEQAQQIAGQAQVLQLAEQNRKKPRFWDRLLKGKGG